MLTSPAGLRSVSPARSHYSERRVDLLCLSEPLFHVPSSLTCFSQSQSPDCRNVLFMWFSRATLPPWEQSGNWLWEMWAPPAVQIWSNILKHTQAFWAPELSWHCLSCVFSSRCRVPDAEERPCLGHFNKSHTVATDPPYVVKECSAVAISCPPLLSQHDVTFPGWQNVHMKMSNCFTLNFGVMSSFLKTRSGKIAELAESRTWALYQGSAKADILVRRV